MARRSILVAIAATVAALLPATAHAGTPTVTTPVYTTPVGLTWTVTALLSETVYRAPGPCGPIPMPGQTAIGTFMGTPGTPPDVPDVAPTVASMTDSPGEGVFCYYLQDDNLVYSGGAQAAVDTQPPIASVAVAPLTAPNFVRGVVTISGGSSDAVSGIASAAFHNGAPGACPGGAIAPVAWNTAAVGDGAEDVCNVVSDNAGHQTIATTSVIIDNTLPVGSVVTPAAGTAVSGTAVSLTTDAADATSLIRNVQWQRSADNVTWVALGAAVTAPAGGYVRAWNTTAAGVGDGTDYVRAVITDNAGNVLTTAATAVVVDNTAPDVKAVVTAPPSVAGSPTLSWTPAHDAIGVARYDVLRNNAVIGTVASIASAQTYSFNDKNAPDHASSTYIVRAYDRTGHALDSDAVVVLVDSTALSAPRSVSAATPTASAPVLTWATPAAFSVNHYDIYRDGLLLGSTVGAVLTYTDSGAAEGTHDYAILARDGASHPSVLSASFKVVFDTTPPTSGGAPTAQLLVDGRVQLAWPAAGDALSGVAGYVVRRASGGTPPAAAEGGTAICTPVEPDCSDVATASGTWSYGVFARDVAGNTALIGTVAGVVINDRTAPLAPTKLSVTRAKAKGTSASVTITLHWLKPTAADLDRVVVVFSDKHAPKEPSDGRSIYRGLGASAKVKVQAGKTAYFALFAYDHSGNVSPPARKVVRLASLIPLRPLTGSVVRTASPKLTWKATKGTAYYNLQLWFKSKRVLVGWPSKASYRVPAGRLVPGTYVWYVWPAVKGKKNTPSFGKLIGRATFTYKKK